MMQQQLRLFLEKTQCLYCYQIITLTYLRLYLSPERLLDLRERGDLSLSRLRRSLSRDLERRFWVSSFLSRSLSLSRLTTSALRSVSGLSGVDELLRRLYLLLPLLLSSSELDESTFALTFFIRSFNSSSRITLKKHTYVRKTSLSINFRI